MGKGLSFEAIDQGIEKPKKMIMVEITEDRISPLCIYWEVGDGEEQGLGCYTVRAAPYLQCILDTEETKMMLIARETT